MSSFGRVRPGQQWAPPRADQQNAWDLAAEIYEIKQRLSVIAEKGRMPVPTEMDVVKVRNDTGGDRLPGEVVQLDIEIIEQPTRLHPWQSAIVPESRCDRYAVLRYATKTGEIRWAQVSGPTFALVDITLGHKKCSPKFNSHTFHGDDDGPIPILWKPADETSGVHLCIVGMGQPLPPGAYVAKIPTGGIPAREGNYPGMAICEIWRLDPHDYNGPQTKSLVPVLRPDETILTKAIYNLSLVAISEEVEYHPVHREECGNWFATISSSDRLVLLSPVSCFRGWEINPQEMFLHEFNGCQWVKTSTQVLAVDPNDTNFLLPDETQFAQLRPGCEAGEMPIYELVGSRGLRRRAKANAAIECNALGSATIHDGAVEDPEPECTGSAIWTYTNGNWAVTAFCGQSWQCQPQPDSFPENPTEGQTYTLPCGGGNQPPPPESECEDSAATECVVDVCNNWGLRQCIPDEAEIELQYLKRGLWSPIFNRGSWYTASLSAPMCPDSLGAHEITNVEPLDYCEDDEALEAITSAINKFGRSGIAGDHVLIKRNNTVCEPTFYITVVLAKCHDIPMPGGCAGDGIFLLKNGCDSIDALIMQKCSVESCTEIPVQTVQFGLVAATVSRFTLTNSECVITLNRFDKSICVLGVGSESAGSPGGSVTFTKERFVKVDWTIDKDTEGSGESETCGTPKLTFSTGYALTLEGCTTDGDPATVDLIEVPVVTEVNWGDANSCPSSKSMVIAFLGAACGPEVEDEAECEDYVCPEGSGSGSG